MFTDELWDAWCAQEEMNYKVLKGQRKYLKKGYTHFDHRFWFPSKKDAFKS